MDLFKHDEKKVKDERIGKEFDICLECYGPEGFNADNMMYAGSPSDGRFSIAYILHDWSEAGVNIFYPMNVKRIKNRYDEGDNIKTHIYEVILAEPEKIRLKYLGIMDKIDLQTK
ncbi:MAG: hypothetical protein OES15_00705 [Nitrosopumilus sp.]|nr:hypothetical protein [Nitrosopumilus sp.]MDH3852827.1 hypothetical protein [Nitrosopumilus sp.]